MFPVAAQLGQPEATGCHSGADQHEQQALEDRLLEHRLVAELRGEPVDAMQFHDALTR